jgi:hypothetical protein
VHPPPPSGALSQFWGAGDAGSQQHCIIGKKTRHLDDSICSMFKGTFQQHCIIGEKKRHLDDSICSMVKGAIGLEGEGSGIGGSMPPCRRRSLCSAAFWSND